MKTGTRVLVAVNDGGQTLQITRPDRDPHHVSFVLYNVDVETVERASTPPVFAQVASWSMPAKAVRGLKEAL